MAQGQTGVSGREHKDEYGNRTSGGESYVYRLYTVHIEGDPRELTMTTPVPRFMWQKKGSLHLGSYKGRWNKKGALEIQFVNEKGELDHQRFFIRAERPLEPKQGAEDKQPEK